LKNHIMAFDQGTTSIRTIIFDRGGNLVGQCQKDFRQIFPADGWIEHDPNDYVTLQLETARLAMMQAGVGASDIAAIGITNQRETVVVWDKNSGKPIYNAIVWQCRRTADYCNELKKSGYEQLIKDKTGLVIDPYFSATKLKWILDNVKGAKEAAKRGDLLFGTVDSWLLWNLTGRKMHATDRTNASRTLLYNIHTLRWDDELLKLFGIPDKMLPEVHPSGAFYGMTDIFGENIVISGIAGDQQAALFGQRCFEPGGCKITYGTGCFMLVNTGNKAISSSTGLLTTLACGIDDTPVYALEGSVFVAGAVVKWLRDELGLISTAAETEKLANSVEDNGGMYFVPAFTGLGAPHWDPYARGTIVGLTRGITKGHFVRASLESMAFQCSDLLRGMQQDLGYKITSVRADGGASANNFLLQFQADLLDCIIERPDNVEATAEGAAILAGFSAGCLDATDIKAAKRSSTHFRPAVSPERREELLYQWHRAVERSRGWDK